MIRFSPTNSDSVALVALPVLGNLIVIYHIIIILFASHYSYSLLSRTLSRTSIPIANFTSGDQVEVGMLMLYDLIPI